MQKPIAFLHWLFTIGALVMLFGASSAQAAQQQAPTFAPPHIDRQILASSDDAQQHQLFGGSLSLTSYGLFMGDAGSLPWFVGLRFTDIDLQQGFDIIQANLKFTAREDSSEPTTLIVFGHDVDDSPTFSAGNGPADRQSEFTTASVTWSPEVWFDGGSYYSADISAIIQEIVDRPGWQPGNAISLIVIDGDGSINNSYRTLVAWDLDPDQAAELTIAYPDLTPVAQPECEAFVTLTLLQQFGNALLNPGSLRECDPDFIENVPEIVHCALEPKCKFTSGAAGLIMLFVGGFGGWKFAGRMGAAKGGMLLFATAGALVLGSISAGVVGGVFSSVTRDLAGQETQALADPDLLQPAIDTDVTFCEDYLKTFAEVVTDETGEVVDILIHIAVPSNVTLPADSRFRITVWDNTGAAHEFVTNDSVFSLAGTYAFQAGLISSPLEWRVGIEVLAGPGGDLWLPFCLPGSVHTFSFGQQVTILESDTLTPMATISATPTPTISPTEALAIVSPLPPSPTFTPVPPKDTSPPKVSGANASPNPALTTSPVTISANISDLSGVANVMLYYHSGEGKYTLAGPMKTGGGNSYTLNIGTLTPAGSYEFRILATDSLGNATCDAKNLPSCPGGTFQVNIP